MRSRGKDVPKPVVALGFALFLVHPTVATADDLSGGQIAGIVISSVTGAALLLLMSCFVFCRVVYRHRQTGDLTWTKGADLEAANLPPHEPLPDAAPNALVGVAAKGSSGGGYKGDKDGDKLDKGSGCDASGSDVPKSPSSPTQLNDDGPTSCETLRPSPSELEHRYHLLRGRSTGGGFAAFLSSKGIMRHGGKDKHLEVSRSARVEPSAEVEMAQHFEPSSTNMGPPLSKSSMLLRWLNGAEDSYAESVAAQLAAAAAAAAEDVGGGKGAAGARAGRAKTVGGVVGGGGFSPFSDRLPLLSLAAQQAGIVWNKMPPSVASSPAVSVAESSSMHMLRGTWKRSDAPMDDTATSGVLKAAAAAAASWHHHGGDERYPPSLAKASVESLKKRHSMQSERSGIVFDYVFTTPANSRVQTAGGANSRAPTIGGAVLPLPPTVMVTEAGAMAGEGTDMYGDFARSVDLMGASAPPPAAVVLLTPRAPPVDGLDQPSRQRQSNPGEQPAPPQLGGVWLYQTPPVKLTSLREAETEGEAVEASPQAPRVAPLQPRLSPRERSRASLSPPSPSSPAAAAGLGRGAGLTTPPAPSPAAAAAVREPSSSPSLPALRLRPGEPAAAPTILGGERDSGAATDVVAVATNGGGNVAGVNGVAPSVVSANGGGGAGANGNGIAPVASAAAAQGGDEDGTTLSQSNSTWTRFMDTDTWLARGRASGGVEMANVVCPSPDGASRQMSATSHATHDISIASPVSLFLPQPPASPGELQSPFSRSDCVGVFRNGGDLTASGTNLQHMALGANGAAATSGAGAAVPEEERPAPVYGTLGTASGTAMSPGAALPPVLMMPPTAGSDAAVSRSSAAVAADQPLALRRRVLPPVPVIPPPHDLAPSSSMKSNRSVSPSMGVHFPGPPAPLGALGDGGDGGEAAEGGVRVGSADGCEGGQRPQGGLQYGRGKSLLNDEAALAALVHLAHGNGH